MPQTPLFGTVLCPVDFSDHSRLALRYAAVMVKRLNGRLIVLFVEDPLLVAAAALAYDEQAMRAKARLALRRFVDQALRPLRIPVGAVTIDVAVGKPDEAINSTSERLKCDLVVMGSHGATGANRLMMGSTTHRVLRTSKLPVLAVPPTKGRGARPGRTWPGPWILAPIDLGSGAPVDALAAAVVARELDTRLKLVHVVEPVLGRPWLNLDAARRNQQRERQALAALTRLKEAVGPVVTDAVVKAGKPARAIAELAASNQVGLVVMTRRRGQGLMGPRQGSISYQVLVDARTPVLALPNEKEWLRHAEVGR